MTTFDIFVFLILGFSVILSFFKGFVKETFSLFSILGGYLMATNYQLEISEIIFETINSESIAKLIAFVSIYLFTAFVISLMGRTFRSMIMSSTQLTFLDRLIGGTLGLVKGVVIVLVLAFPIQNFPNIYQKLTVDSQVEPYIKKALKYLDLNLTSFVIRDQINNLDIYDAKEKVDNFIKSNNIADKVKDLKEKLPSMEKQFKLENTPLDEHSNEDKMKLKDILKSIEKK